MINSSLLSSYSGYIDGRWTEARSRLTMPVYNPATGDHLADVPCMGEEETNAAVAAGVKALRIESTVKERRQWLQSLASLIIQEGDALSEIITLEQGKPLHESRAEVEYAAAFFGHFAQHVESFSPYSLPERIQNCSWKVYHRPAGVVGLITPWNFPLAMIAKKLSAAIAAGCSVVTKPAEATPLSAIALWHLAERVGLPPGKLNLVVGNPAKIGRKLCEHPSVRVISFTGSTETGKLLLQQTAGYVKRLSLELGGNAPFIVFEDADLEIAVKELMRNKFRCAGQTCVCANRVYVHEKVSRTFTEALAPRVADLRVGNGMHDVDIGPLINRAAFDKVTRHVSDAMQKGAHRVVGDSPRRPSTDWGCYYPATVLVGVTAQMRVFQEETFGPLIAMASFRSTEEVISLANDTPYGLAAYVITQDEQKALRCASELGFGYVGLNTGVGPTPEAPFGGMKQSGFGREGGKEGLEEFCEKQTVVIA